MAPKPIVPPELLAAPFTLDEARAAGLTRRQLQGRTWSRIGSQLYCWAGRPYEPLGVLRALHRRLPDAVFAGCTAGWLHGLDVRPLHPIQIVLPTARGVRAAGLSASRALLLPDEIVARKGLPTAFPARTVADLIRPSTLVEAVVIADEALHKRLVDRQQLERYSGARLRRVLGLANAASESPMETRLRLILVLAGLPVPRVQESLYADGILLGRVDLYYPDARLAIEYNGQTHRSTLVEDNRRQNRLINAGFRLLRFTAADLRSPDAVVRQVRSALDSARRRLN